MTRNESKERFNSLPREIRITVIGSQLVEEIRILERERESYISAHKANLKRINDRIKRLEKSLTELSD